MFSNFINNSFSNLRLKYDELNIDGRNNELRNTNNNKEKLSDNINTQNNINNKNYLFNNYKNLILNKKPMYIYNKSIQPSIKNISLLEQ